MVLLEVRYIKSQNGTLKSLGIVLDNLIICVPQYGVDYRGLSVAAIIVNGAIMR